jgi:hypothetical protein
MTDDRHAVLEASAVGEMRGDVATTEVGLRRPARAG